MSAVTAKVIQVSTTYSTSVNYGGTINTTATLPDGFTYLGSGLHSITFSGVNGNGGCKNTINISYDGFKTLNIQIQIAGNWGAATASGTIVLNVFVY